MANLYFGNESDLILDGMRLARDGSFINDADMEAHFFDPDGAKGVTGASNASPIVITSAAHGFEDGDEVVIAHVLGNTAANGRWIVDNKTANTFELTGSTGNGSYTQGGHIYPAIENGTELAMEYQADSNGRYVATIPADINMLPEDDARCIIFCSNYAFQMERDHRMMVRT